MAQLKAARSRVEQSTSAVHVWRSVHLSRRARPFPAVITRREEAALRFVRSKKNVC